MQALKSALPRLPEWRRRTWVAFGAGALIVFLVVKCYVVVAVPREPLDRLWETHMLAGTPAYLLYDGTDFRTRDTDFNKLRSFREADGTVSGATVSDHGLSILYDRESCLLGLWGLGGWEFRGGLLRRAEHRDTTIDLYGKQVTRVEPYFPFHFHRERPERSSFEFFLVRRARPGAAGGVVRVWRIDRELFRASEKYPFLSGDLSYDPTSRTATVRITGLSQPFEDRVVVAAAR